MQKSRFTASKPSIFAIASGEKFIRHLVTSFHQRSLSQSQYQNDPTKPNFGTLTATTYGNGAKVSSRYDDFNRVTGVVYGEETAPRYEYDYNAKGQVARVRDNLLNRTTQSEYDLANRPVRVKTSEDAKHVYTGQVAYDNVYGNLSEFTEKVGENRQEFGTKFGYDDENRPTSLTYSVGATTIGQSTTTIDKLNRTTFSAVKLGSKTFTSEYHFAAGGYGTGSVTNLVSSITQPGCNCGYGYDDNGNIASATLNGKWTGYTYDALGQLIQVNDHSDTRSGENGTTWKYTYDLGGNILKKERFAYNDTTTPLETVTYTYGDANWRDKLTAVNGSTICYDAIGNPLNDGTWTYTWQNGRQLQKMQKAGVTVEFVYNADGLRVQKTVNGVATKYTLHGKNVVHMTSGTDELHFFYDAQNRPTVVVYNGVPYAYVKSLQGDIVAILDENGNMVVSYGYDAWGAPLWCTGELAETLGKVQPFRYRGYVFDEETGLYYLRSRYYNAERCRFVNADSVLLNGLLGSNQQAYCCNNPVMHSDNSGYGKELSITTIEPFGAHDWGTHTTKLPASLMIGFMVSLAENYQCNYGDGLFIKEKKDGTLNIEIDCIGVFNMPAKFWMTRETFRTTYNIGTGTNSALRNLEGTAENRLYKLDLSNLSVLNIGSVIYSKDKRHVYMYIGYYVSPTGTVIEHAVLQAAAGKKFSNDTLKIQSIDSVLSPYQYGNYEYIDYDITYEDTVNFYNPPLQVGK